MQYLAAGSAASQGMQGAVVLAQEFPPFPDTQGQSSSDPGQS